MTLPASDSKNAPQSSSYHWPHSASLVVAAALLSPSMALAVDNWTGTQDSDWTDNANWSNNSTPIAAADLRINATVNAPVLQTDLVSAPGTFNSLSVGDNGGAATLTISYGGSGNNAGLLANTVAIGTGATGLATLLVQGDGGVNGVQTYIGANNIFVVGNSSGGQLDLLNDAEAESAGSFIIGSQAGATGTVNISGNSTLASKDIMLVGFAGTGSLNADTGSVITTRKGAYVGFTGDGSVNLSGAGTIWGNSGNSIDIGASANGNGTVTITDGAEIESVSQTGDANSNALQLGVATNSSGTLNISGTASNTSKLTTTGEFKVGVQGDGTLNIGAYSTVDTANANSRLSIGHLSGGNGTVNVSGTNALLDSAIISIGNNASGTLNISDGGQVNSSADATIGLGTMSQGAVNLSDGGSWSIDSGKRLFVGDGGTAALNILSGSSVSSYLAYVGNGPDGTGTVRVDGTNSKWTNTDDLIIGASGEGTLTVSNGAEVNTAAKLKIAQAFSGTGAVNIGAAVGEQAAAAGTLSIGDAIEFGAGTGSLNFNHTDENFTLASNITSGSGTASINQIAGVTTLSGDTSGYTGTVNVSGGRLYVNGDISNGNVVMAGGTLGGSGNIGTLNVTNGSRLAPGNSVGTINVTDLTLNSGSIYEVELNDGGFVAGTHNDLINASGTATINGGTVHVLAENGGDDGTTYTPGTYTILTATGGVSGNFDNLIDNYAFLDFALSYDANNVLLTSALAAGGFCASGMSTNQCAAGDGVFSLGAGSLYTSVLNLSDAAAANALDQLSGEIHASAKTAFLEDSRFSRAAAFERLRSASGGVNSDKAGIVERTITDTSSSWGYGFGSWGHWDGNDNAAKLERDIGGFFIGGDVLAADNSRLGLMGGYSHTDLQIDNRASSGTVDTYTLGVYGGTSWNAFSLKGGIAYGWHNIDTDRKVAFTGFSNTLSTSYDASTVQVFAEAAYKFDGDTVRFEPFAGLAYVNLDTEGFTENGGSAALKTAGDTKSINIAKLGLRTETDMEVGATTALLHGMIGWDHAFGDDAANVKHSFEGGDTFFVKGVPYSRNTLTLDLALDAHITENTSLNLGYNGRISSDSTDQGVSASLNVSF
ncbi:MAG: autotransporter domain-containing protein [Oceanospirillales bacterium]|nr:autotransporter domain-containing protein [Oceanospirillales bacterium]